MHRCRKRKRKERRHSCALVLDKGSIRADNIDSKYVDIKGRRRKGKGAG